MSAHITTHRAGFAPGVTAITRLDDRTNETGIGLAVLRLRAGEQRHEKVAVETAWLLMHGKLSGRLCKLTPSSDAISSRLSPHAGQPMERPMGQDFEMQRQSLFDESASCIHVPAGTVVELSAETDVELTVYTCANTQPFTTRLFRAADVPNEYRGRGQVHDRSLRFVRTIFDRRNSPDEVQLVLGEVVTLPGGWSSYPPHHHAQPEIYHYRFSAPQGYGHAEIGEQVVKVREYDTIRIPAGKDHAQCAAPGYGMYYSWVIRHLPGNPYTMPEFTPEHAWTMTAGASFWWPRELP